MAKEETIEPQKVQQPTERKEKKESIAWIWYTQRPLNARVQSYNRYLDSCQVSWINLVTGRAAWAYSSFPQIELKDDNSELCNDLWILNVYNKQVYWKLQWKTTESWWIEIPQDWNYQLTIQRTFRTDLEQTSWATPTFWVIQQTINWTTFYSVDIESKKLVFFTNVEKEWDPITAYVYAWSEYSSIVPNVMVTNYTWTFSKWVVLYTFADFRRVGKKIPIICTVYLTKIS